MRDLPVLTAESEQTKAMAHLDLAYDTNHLKDTNRQAAKEAKSVKKITDVTNNQITHLLKCEEHELVNISTGHKAESTDLARAREESCCSKRNRQ